jgi:hypothetical protein
MVNLTAINKYKNYLRLFNKIIFVLHSKTYLSLYQQKQVNAFENN